MIRRGLKLGNNNGIVSSVKELVKKEEKLNKERERKKLGVEVEELCRVWNELYKEYFGVEGYIRNDEKIYVKNLLKKFSFQNLVVGMVGLMHFCAFEEWYLKRGVVARFKNFVQGVEGWIVRGKKVLEGKDLELGLRLVKEGFVRTVEVGCSEERLWEIVKVIGEERRRRVVKIKDGYYEWIDLEGKRRTEFLSDYLRRVRKEGWTDYEC